MTPIYNVMQSVHKIITFSRYVKYFFDKYRFFLDLMISFLTSAKEVIIF